MKIEVNRTSEIIERFSPRKTRDQFIQGLYGYEVGDIIFELEGEEFKRGLMDYQSTGQFNIDSYFDQAVSILYEDMFCFDEVLNLNQMFGTGSELFVGILKKQILINKLQIAMLYIDSGFLGYGTNALIRCLWQIIYGKVSEMGTDGNDLIIPVFEGDDIPDFDTAFEFLERFRLEILKRDMDDMKHLN